MIKERDSYIIALKGLAAGRQGQGYLNLGD